LKNNQKEHHHQLAPREARPRPNGVLRLQVVSSALWSRSLCGYLTLFGHCIFQALEFRIKESLPRTRILAQFKLYPRRSQTRGWKTFVFDLIQRSIWRVTTISVTGFRVISILVNYALLKEELPDSVFLPVIISFLDALRIFSSGFLFFLFLIFSYLDLYLFR
jgi:hypothetical protein